MPWMVGQEGGEMCKNLLQGFSVLVSDELRVTVVVAGFSGWMRETFETRGPIHKNILRQT